VRIVSICALAPLLAAALVAQAGAQEPGVFIDPGAPSAKEYALPFESERRQADPDQGPTAQIAPGSRESPAFGEGITSRNVPSSSGNAPTYSRKSVSGGGSRESKKTRRQIASGGVASVIRAATSNPGAPAGGADVTLTIAGIGLGVLLVGGVAGLLWRRRAS
jgi:hypothetical protein